MATAVGAPEVEPEQAPGEVDGGSLRAVDLLDWLRRCSPWEGGMALTAGHCCAAGVSALRGPWQHKPLAGWFLS